ncbi:MAG: TIGR03943 family protein [Pleurocapsa sp. SU_5_0]|nr:TIGR03943 family protein [Pleurocapsa sp. SU_5_0]NJR44728.1 TIGR03943 family protein [Hyellaceae cyanobacterium CSU_1_1]
MNLANPRKANPNKNNPLFSWLDGLALLTWGSLLLKYTITGQYKLLIHPNYYGLVLASSIILLGLGIVKIKLTLAHTQQKNSEHIALFSPGFSSSLLICVAIAGLMIPPKILTSQSAMKTGVRDIPLTRSQPQSFRTVTKPEERSLIEWIRTINAYPEPDAYKGQLANVSGFVLHLKELPDNYLMLSRFVITCCAVDAYPIGIPVKLETSRNTYPPDTWLQIQGAMIAETLPIKEQVSKTTMERRSVVLAAKSIKSIPIPADPYGYK